MCLGVPMKVIQKKSEESAIVDMGGSKLEICTVFTPSVKEGDYVIVHAGFSISIISLQEVQELSSILQNLKNKDNLKEEGKNYD